MDSVLSEHGEVGVRIPRRPRPASDARFTIGLTLDIRRVLIDHGYPVLSPDDATAGTEFIELQQAIFKFLYVDTDLGTRPVA